MDTNTQEYLQKLNKERSDLKREVKRLRESLQETRIREAGLNAKIGAISSLLGGLAQAQDLNQKISLILRKTKEFTAADRVTLYMVQGEDLESFFKDGDEVKTIHLPLGRGMAGRVARSGNSILMTDPEAEGGPDQVWLIRTGYPVQTAMTVPLKNAQGVFGVLQVLNRADGQPFGEENLTWFHLFAAVVSLLFPGS